jgi:hypothetical protein
MHLPANNETGVEAPVSKCVADGPFRYGSKVVAGPGSGVQLPAET